MFNDFDKGGLRMIDIVSFHDSVMLELAESLLSPETADWKPLAAAFFKPVGGLSVFRSRLNKVEDFQGSLSISSSFWRTVLMCWIKHAKCESSPLSVGDPIFNNSSLSFKGRVLFSSTCLRNGIICIKDMFINNSLITFANFKARCNNYPGAVIDFHCICSSLMKLNIHNLAAPNESFHFKGLSVGKIGRKVLYSLIKPTEEPISHAFWKRKFNVDIQGINWRLVHQLKEGKLIALNWKILHNIYPTNTTLLKMKLTHTNLCLHCDGNELDHIGHFFFSCNKIKVIWHEVQADLLGFMDINIKLTEQIVLLGANYIQNIDQKQLQQINLVIAIAKQAISKYKFDPTRRSIVVIYENEATIRNLWGNF